MYIYIGVPSTPRAHRYRCDHHLVCKRCAGTTYVGVLSTPRAHRYRSDHHLVCNAHQSAWCASAVVCSDHHVVCIDHHIFEPCVVPY